jgi:hypothetical protein
LLTVLRDNYFMVTAFRALVCEWEGI